MASSIPIHPNDPTAPTPQNTPLTHAPIAQGLSRPTVPDITESEEPEDGEEDEARTGAALPANAHAAMLGLVQGKLAGLLGRSSGYVESLPVEVRRSVEALKGVQAKHNQLQNQYKRECLELEKKVHLTCFLLSHLHLSFSITLITFLILLLLLGIVND
jgi:nucleosome assembly protein 1-like 1